MRQPRDLGIHHLTPPVLQRAMIRAPRCTSIPMYPSSCRDGSPECSPIPDPDRDTAGQSWAASVRCAAAQQATASAADSNTTQKLSPSAPISRPRQ